MSQSRAQQDLEWFTPTIVIMGGIQTFVHLDRLHQMNIYQIDINKCKVNLNEYFNANGKCKLFSVLVEC